jgi:hypothetical protein
MVSERRDTHYNNNKKNRTGERKMLTQATGSANKSSQTSTE